MANGFMNNAHRVDPYKNYKFRVKIADGDTVLGVSKVGPLKRTTEVVRHRCGGENSHESPSRRGGRKYDGDRARARHHGRTRSSSAGRTWSIPTPATWRWTS